MKPAEISPETTPAFELKGSALTIMVLYLWDADSQSLTRQLQEKFGKVPGFFKNLPLIIDLAALQDSEQIPDFVQLATTLHSFGLVPTAVRGGNAAQNAQAIAANLGLLSSCRNERVVESTSSETEALHPNPDPQPNLPPGSGQPTKVISQPIRSGQRVVAPHGDLIVLAAVNAGAEILAAGNIHVYGPLRGRALAGVKGDTEARIVCLQFQPELVAIAGEYMVNDEMDPAQFGQSTVISLADNQLKIEPFGSFIPLP